MLFGSDVPSGCWHFLSQLHNAKTANVELYPKSKTLKPKTHNLK